MATTPLSTNSGRDAPQWMKDLGVLLGVIIIPPVIIPVLIAVAVLGLLAFLPFLPPLFGEFMAGSTSSADAEKQRAGRKHGAVVPLGAKELPGHAHA